MRSRIGLLAILLIGAVSIPIFAHAQSIPFWGPIIPSALATCPIGWAGVVAVINNIIRFLITFVMLFVAPLMFAYAGFILVVNPFNSGAKSEAKSIFLNTIVGLVIALCAWLIVDAIMAVLYNGSFGTWYTIVTDGNLPPCLSVSGYNPAPPGTTAVTGPGVTPGVPLAPPARGQISSACSAEALAPTFGPYAAAMSCVTLYENSSCNPGMPSGTDHTTTGEPLSIGLFQVNLTANNLNYPACEIAAGVSGNLNCTQAFNGVLTQAGTSVVTLKNPSLYSSCVTAASDVACNLAAAKNAFDIRQGRGQNPLSAWGTRAQTNCSSLAPTASAASPEHSPFEHLIAATMLSLQHLTL